MTETIEKFELETIADASSGTLAIKGGYDAALARVNAILADPSYQVAPITNDAAYKEAKKIRASFNGAIKAIDRRRIDTINDFTIQFSHDCKSITALLDQRQLAFKEVINAWEDSLKTVVGETTAKKFTATIKFTDEKLVKKLTDFCNKNGCELTIK